MQEHLDRFARLIELARDRLTEPERLVAAGMAKNLSAETITEWAAITAEDFAAMKGSDVVLAYADCLKLFEEVRELLVALEDFARLATVAGNQSVH